MTKKGGEEAAHELCDSEHPVSSQSQPTSLAEIQLPHLQIFPVNHSQQTRKSQLQMLPHCSSRINNQQSSPSSPHLRLPIKA